MSIRLIPAIKTPQFVSTLPPFSNFAFIDERYGYNYPLHRIFSQLRVLGYKTMIIEDIPSVGFSKEDDQDLLDSGIVLPCQSLKRLSFFNKKITEIRDISYITDEDFLGYAIMKYSINRWIVFESVIKTSRFDNNFIHTQREYEVNVVSSIFTIKGILFCQQNIRTNRCAHATLRTCLSMLHNDADYSYKKMNDVLKQSGLPNLKDSKGDSLGLSPDQIFTILNHENINYSQMSYFSRDDKKGRYKDNPDIPFQSFLYGSIESGYPAILGFSFPEESQGHVIPILGHTFNEDTWVPDAEKTYFKISSRKQYIQSESWVSTYICHDDNFGSYYCLPRHYLTDEYNVFVVSINPTNTKYDAIYAESQAALCLYEMLVEIKKKKPSNLWLQRLINRFSGGWFVLRTLHLNSVEYIKHLRSLTGWGTDSVIPEKIFKILQKSLPEHIWMVEISLPEVFPC